MGIVVTPMSNELHDGVDGSRAELVRALLPTEGGSLSESAALCALLVDAIGEGDQQTLWSTLSSVRRLMRELQERPESAARFRDEGAVELLFNLLTAAQDRVPARGTGESEFSDVGGFIRTLSQCGCSTPGEISARLRLPEEAIEALGVRLMGQGLVRRRSLGTTTLWELTAFGTRSTSD